MLLKLLFLAIIIYYLTRTFRSLVRAMSGDGNASRLNNQQRQSGWQQSNGRDAGKYEDVEDAKYVDIK